ncbi:MAG TPA: aldo/keto reductase [Allosphingosinicella sp.]
MEPRYWYGLDRASSPIGFGCWQLAGRYALDGVPQGWTDIEAGEAIDLVHFALDHGIRFFDTAADYGDGRSETLLGEALASSPAGAGAIVCTKAALTPDEAEAGRLGPRFARAVEASLRRLRRDRIDILLLHNPPDFVDWRDFDRTLLDDLRTSGKILTYGVSSRSLGGAERVLEAGFGTCIEWALNLLERRPVRRLFPGLAAARMNFIARSPLSRGLVVPRSGPVVFSGEDFRSTLPQAWVEWAAAAAASLSPLAEEHGGSARFALRYGLSFAETSALIPGLHRRRHVRDLLDAAEAGPLDAATLARIEAAVGPCYPPWSGT